MKMDWPFLRASSVVPSETTSPILSPYDKAILLGLELRWLRIAGTMFLYAE